MSRLDEKKIKIQKDLEQWANENRILAPGERIVFSIEIQKIPLVVEESKKGHGQIKPEEWFLPARMKKEFVGDGINVTNRTLNILAHIFFTIKSRSEIDGTTPPSTMEEVMERHPDISNFYRFPNVGERTLPHLAYLFLKGGLSFTDENCFLKENRWASWLRQTDLYKKAML